MFIVDLFVILLGLLLGSFYNVVAIRLLQQSSFIYPASHCPSCKHPLSPLDLIPVLSFLILRGKCRFCQRAISPLYPLGELAAALTFYLVYKHLGMVWELLPAFLLSSLLLLSVMTDIREKLILDVITLPGIAVLLLMRFFIGEEGMGYYLLGGLVGFSLLFFIMLISKGGMGMGDVKLYLAIGVALGPWLTLISFVAAAFLGTLVGFILMAKGKVSRKEPIPFAPFIWLGTLMAYIWGWPLWSWYSSFWS